MLEMKARQHVLAVKRTQGVRLGRPRDMPDAIRRRIERMHRSGMKPPAIAERLNAEAVPTARGGKRWYASTVQKVLFAK